MFLIHILNTSLFINYSHLFFYFFNIFKVIFLNSLFNFSTYFSKLPLLCSYFNFYTLFLSFLLSLFHCVFIYFAIFLHFSYLLIKLSCPFQPTCSFKVTGSWVFNFVSSRSSDWGLSLRIFEVMLVSW